MSSYFIQTSRPGSCRRIHPSIALLLPGSESGVLGEAKRTIRRLRKSGDFPQGDACIVVKHEDGAIQEIDMDGRLLRVTQSCPVDRAGEWANEDDWLAGRMHRRML